MMISISQYNILNNSAGSFMRFQEEDILLDSSFVSMLCQSFPGPILFKPPKIQTLSSLLFVLPCISTNQNTSA